MKFLWVVFCFLIGIWICNLHGYDVSAHKTVEYGYKPWFTGPLLAPSGLTLPQGHLNIQPYLYLNAEIGKYNNNWQTLSNPVFYSNTFQVQAKYGLTRILDVQIQPQIICNTTQYRSYTGIGDLPISLDIQIVNAKIHDHWPDLKLTFGGSIPSGKFQHLHSDRKKTDAIGSGVWAPSITFVIAKLWEVTYHHFINLRFSFQHTWGTSVHVKGLNNYGGTKTTNGRVFPGNSFVFNGAIQYNLTRNWALACDLYYQHNHRNRFSGHVGDDGTMTSPSSEQWSLAPAIEYNWSANVGLLSGVWFTFAGRNSTQFINGIVSVNIYL